jgi:hypothetical protein
MEDKLVRGKHEDAQMLAEFKTASLALAEFNVQLEHEASRREEGELVKIKASGDMVTYNTKLALHQAKGFSISSTAPKIQPTQPFSDKRMP